MLFLFRLFPQFSSDWNLILPACERDFWFILSMRPRKSLKQMFEEHDKPKEISNIFSCRALRTALINYDSRDSGFFVSHAVSVQFTSQPKNRY